MFIAQSIHFEELLAIVQQRRPPGCSAMDEAAGHISIEGRADAETAADGACDELTHTYGDDGSTFRIVKL